MPSSASLLSFALLSTMLVLVPGPSVMFIVSTALARGRRAALITVLGNTFGIYLQVLLVAMGLGAIVERSVVVFTVVKSLGAAYLVWLGVQAIRNRDAGESMDTDMTFSTRPRALFKDGLVVGLANPKSIVFFSALLPQFVEPTAVPASVQMAALGLIFVLVALVLDSAWGFAAGSARNWITRSPGRLGRLRAGGGVVMIGLGVRLAISGRSN